MRRIIPILLIVLLFQNCQGSELENGGYFKAVNNDLLYALFINPEMDSIQFFVLDRWPIDTSKETLAAKQNFEMYRSGNIQVIADQLLITDLESDFLPSIRPKLNHLIYKNGKIYVDCENITQYFLSMNTRGICESKFIVFSRMDKHYTTRTIGNSL